MTGTQSFYSTCRFAGILRQQRPTLTDFVASACACRPPPKDKPAFEGYEGHGVFTWTLLDALRNGSATAMAPLSFRCWSHTSRIRCRRLVPSSMVAAARRWQHAGLQRTDSRLALVHRDRISF